MSTIFSMGSTTVCIEPGCYRLGFTMLFV